MQDRRQTTHPRSGFARQVDRLRKVAADLQDRDPEGAAACLFAASVLSNLPQSTGVENEPVYLPGEYADPHRTKN